MLFGSLGGLSGTPLLTQCGLVLFPKCPIHTEEYRQTRTHQTTNRGGPVLCAKQRAFLRGAKPILSLYGAFFTGQQASKKCKDNIFYVVLARQLNVEITTLRQDFNGALKPRMRCYPHCLQALFFPHFVQTSARLWRIHCDNHRMILRGVWLSLKEHRKQGPPRVELGEEMLKEWANCTKPSA